MNKYILCGLVVAAGAACDAVGEDIKDDVQAMQEESDLASASEGKGDGFDQCAQHGYYGDGECDPWCPLLDEDDCTHDQLFLTLTGNMVEFGSNAPLTDGTVCGSGNCGAIDASGDYAVEIRKRRLVEVTTSKTGFVPALMTFKTRNGNFRYTNKLPTEGLLTALAQIYLGVTSVDPTKGALVTNAYHWLANKFPPLGSSTAAFAGLAGVSYTLERVGGGAGAFKTLYFGTNNLPDPALTATSDNGVSVSGELTAGLYKVTANVPAGWKCRPRLLPTRPGPAIDAMVTVKAHTLSGLWTQCIED